MPFSTIFARGDNFCDFWFVFLYPILLQLAGVPTPFRPPRIYQHRSRKISLRATATSVDQDQPVHTCNLIWICTGCKTVAKTFKTLLINCRHWDEQIGIYPTYVTKALRLQGLLEVIAAWELKFQRTIKA